MPKDKYSPNDVFQSMKTLIETMPIDSLYALREQIITAVEYEQISEEMADDLSMIMAERTAWIDAEGLFD
jgi:hypothetical protein